MKTLAAVLIVPAVTVLAVLVGWAIHGDALEQFVPYYVLGGCVVGIGASFVVSREPVVDEREPGDYIETVASRDAYAAAFKDLVIVLLVSAVVFSIVDPARGLSVYVPGITALALIDAGVRQRRLNRQYAP